MADEELKDPVRAQLMAELSDRVDLETLPSEVCALLWFSDIEQLRSIVDRAREPEVLRATLDGYLFARVSRKWTSRAKGPTAASRDTSVKRRVSVASAPAQSPSSKRPKLSLNTSPPSPSPVDRTPGDQTPVGRDSSLTGPCLKRDNNRCLITEAGMPLEVAHIYPYSMHKQEETTELRKFWDTLQFFWAKEKVDAWRNAISGLKGTETLINRLSLAPSAHRYWGNTMFALKPLKRSEDGTSMEVQFFWLPRNSPGARTIATPPVIHNDMESTGDNIRLFNCADCTIIKSGRVLTFTTDDPKDKPLPSYALLDLQWALHRVAALSGASEEQDSDGDDDDDDDDFGIYGGIAADMPKGGDEDSGDDSDSSGDSPDNLPPRRPVLQENLPPRPKHTGRQAYPERPLGARNPNA